MTTARNKTKTLSIEFNEEDYKKLILQADIEGIVLEKDLSEFIVKYYLDKNKKIVTTDIDKEPNSEKVTKDNIIISTIDNKLIEAEFINLKETLLISLDKSLIYQKYIDSIILCILRTILDIFKPGEFDKKLESLLSVKTKKDLEDFFPLTQKVIEAVNSKETNGEFRNNKEYLKLKDLLDSIGDNSADYNSLKRTLISIDSIDRSMFNYFEYRKIIDSFKLLPVKTLLDTFKQQNIDLIYKNNIDYIADHIEKANLKATEFARENFNNDEE